MTGELILTSYTYDEGRTAINEAFSGSASFNTLSASTIYSGSTNLYDIFLTEASIAGDFLASSGGTLSGPLNSSSGFTATTETNKPLILNGNTDAIAGFGTNQIQIDSTGTTIGSTGNTANNAFAIAGGYNCLSNGSASMAFGFSVSATSTGSAAFGNGNESSGTGSLVFGTGSYAQGDYSLAGGQKAITQYQNSIAIGENVQAQASSAIVFGTNSYSKSSNSFAIGSSVTADTKAGSSFVFGDNNRTSGNYSFAGGSGNIASGEASQALGSGTTSSGPNSNSQGYLTLASGYYSHAEGVGTSATTTSSHSEGEYTIASGQGSHTGGLGLGVDKIVKATATASFNHSYVGSADASGSTESYSFILGGQNHSALAIASGIIGGTTNTIYPYSRYAIIIGGSNQTIYGNARNSVIVGGNLNVINEGIQKSVILGGQGITATTEDTAYAYYLDVNQYIDLQPNSSLPNSNVGRIAVTGNTLFFCTGVTGTASDWMALS